MKTDRELLELAAKAAGVEVVLWRPDGSPHVALPNDTVSRLWNPLTDDGDALRLAVKLCIDVKPPRDEEDLAQARHIDAHEGWFEFQEDDPYASTRRAIVLAAAAIAEQRAAAKELAP